MHYMERHCDKYQFNPVTRRPGECLPVAVFAQWMIGFLLILVPALFGFETDRYFGIPVGTINDKEANLEANVFISDEHTIAFDKFSHNTEDPSCYTVMIGPARKEDESKQIGPGILLPYSQMDFSWEELRAAWKRKKRHLEKQNLDLEDMINSLEVTNPRWRIRYHLSKDHDYQISLDKSTPSSVVNDGSYEVIEYVDEEETEEKEENIPSKQKLALYHFASFPLPPPMDERIITSEAVETATFEFLEPVLEDLDRIPEASVRSSIDIRSFLLPSAKNDQAVFLLTNGAKLTDYNWLGLWNNCLNKSTPHVWLVDVDPPREEEILPLKNAGGKVISGNVRILNCNTLLIQKLWYKPHPLRLRTYFYAGTIGQNGIENKTRVKVIGYDLAEPLEEFDGDDIMLRLPKGIRTFDVDFLSIYNEDGQRTLAKTEIPSTLVPPCND